GACASARARASAARYCGSGRTDSSKERWAPAVETSASPRSPARSSRTDRASMLVLEDLAGAGHDRLPPPGLSSRGLHVLLVHARRVPHVLEREAHVITGCEVRRVRPPLRPLLTRSA